MKINKRIGWAKATERYVGKKNPFENAVSASSELASRQHCTVVRQRLKSIVWASSEPAPDAASAAAALCTLFSPSIALYCTILHCSHQATAANVLLHALQSTQCRLQSIPESKITARFANVALFHRCDLICEAPPSLLRFPAICAAPALLPCCW